MFNAYIMLTRVGKKNVGFDLSRARCECSDSSKKVRPYSEIPHCTTCLERKHSVIGNSGGRFEVLRISHVLVNLGEIFANNFPILTFFSRVRDG